jgi:hypothetical protein
VVDIDVLIMGHLHLFSIAMSKLLKKMLEAAVPIGHLIFPRKWFTSNTTRMSGRCIELVHGKYIKYPKHLKS